MKWIKGLICAVLCTAPTMAGVSNDECADALGLSSLNGSVIGDTLSASPEVGFATCGTSLSAPGVWYSFIGDGTTIQITTCGSDITDYDTKLNVYCRSCELPACVAGNDDGSPSGVSPDPNCVIPETGSTANRASTVTFCSQNGAEYLILVQGFNNAVGNFEMTIRSDGVLCTGAVACLPVGGCCVDGVCRITTRNDCATAGGAYQGDNSNCGDGTYDAAGFQACAMPLEDISGTGTIAAFASSGDDNAEEVGIPFTFQFFGVGYTSIWVGSNGMLQLPPSTEAEADDFSNDPIPSAILPNRIIAPLWDDLTTTAATASVFVETRGAAPNRRFIVQWEEVPQLSGGGAMTFQAILYEGSNDIEFRYETVVSSTAGDYSIGIEDGDGLSGFAVPQDSIVNGACFEIAYVPGFNPCDNEEPCPDMDNSGLVDLSDLARLLAAFGRSVGDPLYDAVPDFDNSGTVDLSDLAALLALFGLPCP